jgi:hypothetical protein
MSQRAALSIVNLRSPLAILCQAVLIFALSLILLSLLFKFTPLLVPASMIIAFVAGCSLIIDASSVLHQRIAKAYLLLISVLYLLFGILGVTETGQPFAVTFSEFCVVPGYSFFNFFGRCITFSPCIVQDLAPSPPGCLNWTAFFSFQACLGALALVGTIGLLRKKRWARGVWAGLATLLTIAALWDLAGAWLSAGAAGRIAHVWPFGFLPLAWSASYVLAYLASSHSERELPGRESASIDKASA